MGQKSGPRVRIDTRITPSGYGLATRGVRHREGTWQGRGTLQNVSDNAVASSGDKPVGEVLPFDITSEIDDTAPSRRGGRSPRTL